MNELPLLNVLRARVELKEETEESDRESEVLAKSVAKKTEADQPAKNMEPKDEPASKKETVGVVNLPRRELPARERRLPPWLGEYVYCLYRLFYYMTQMTEPVLRMGDVVNEHTLQ